MNEIIPKSFTPELAVLYSILPLLSLYALGRIIHIEGSRFLRWNNVPAIPFSIIEIVTIVSLSALVIISSLTPFLPLVIFGAAVFYTRKFNVHLLDQWGLNAVPWPRCFRWSCNTYLALFLPVSATAILSVLICRELGYTDFTQDSIKQFESGEWKKMVQILVLAIVLAPLWEEMFFRGILYPWLKSKIPRSGALLISALLFASIHYHLPSFLPLVVFGIALALVYEYSGSLISSILLHGIFNFATCLSLLIQRQP